ADRPNDDVAVQPGALRVTYVLPEVRLAGGALGVAQVVNELRLLGVDARIVALRERADAYRWRFFTEPLVFAHVDALVAGTPESDIVVATHWTTAEWASRLVRAGRGVTSAYFIQDYEAWFYPESDTESRANVKASYGRIANRMVQSSWLAELVQADGFE